MKYGLFIDLPSVTHILRRRFGRKARLDLLLLPKHIKDAIKIPKNINWDSLHIFNKAQGQYKKFASLVESFGYKMHILSQDSWDVDIAMLIMRYAKNLEGIVFVSSNKRMFSLIENLLYEGKNVHIISPVPFINLPGIKTTIIEEDWIWRQEVH